MIGKRADRPGDQRGIRKAVFLHALPIQPADMVQVTVAQAIRIWISALAIATGKYRAPAELPLHQLHFHKNVSGFSGQRDIDGGRLAGVFMENIPFILFKAGLDITFRPFQANPRDALPQRFEILPDHQRPNEIEGHGLAGKPMVEILVQGKGILAEMPPLFRLDEFRHVRANDVLRPQVVTRQTIVHPGMGRAATDSEPFPGGIAQRCLEILMTDVWPGFGQLPAVLIHLKSDKNSEIYSRHI